MRTFLKQFLLAAAAVAVLYPGTAAASLTRIAGPADVHHEGRMLVKFDVAFDPANQVYLVVWGTQHAGPVNGLFLNAGGGVVYGPFAISSGSQQAGWARVIHGGGKFAVSYTRILGFEQHQREVRFVTYQPGTSPAMSSEIVLDSWAGGAATEPGLAYSNGRYLVTWWNWPGPYPQSYVTVMDSSGNRLVTKLKVTTDGDGQTDPEIACDSARGRCLIIGHQWGTFNPGWKPGTWGQFITDTGQLIDGGFTVAWGPVQQEDSLVYSAAADRYIVTFSRNQNTVFGLRIDGGSRQVLDEWTDGAQRGGYILRDANMSPEGVGFGRPRIAYNPATQTSILAMRAWVGTTAALEVNGAGAGMNETFQLVPGVHWTNAENGSREVAPAVDSANARMLIADNQAFLRIRATVFGATGSSTPPPPPPAPSCSIAFSSTSQTFGPLGGGGGFTLTTGDSCAWTAASNASWIKLSESSKAGTGTKVLSYTVEQNTSGAQRSGIIYSGNRSLTITQTAPTGRMADFSRDGRNDIIWQNQVTGEIAVWRMNGLTAMAGASLSPAFVDDTNWKIVGTLDADKNGYVDLLLQHDNGLVAIWRMAGETRVGADVLNVSTVADPRWRIVGTGDLDSDGHDDIIWQHASGPVAVWYMNGLQQRGGEMITSLSDSRWRVAGADDFNQDGKLDLLWHHSATGQVAVWFMNGTQLVDGRLVDRDAHLPWQIEGTGDFNADGYPDILWRNTQTGHVGGWYMRAATVLGVTMLTPSQVGTSWRIAGPR